MLPPSLAPAIADALRRTPPEHRAIFERVGLCASYALLFVRVDALPTPRDRVAARVWLSHCMHAVQEPDRAAWPSGATLLAQLPGDLAASLEAFANACQAALRLRAARAALQRALRDQLERDPVPVAHTPSVHPPRTSDEVQR